MCACCFGVSVGERAIQRDEHERPDHDLQITPVVREYEAATSEAVLDSLTLLLKGKASSHTCC